MNTFVPIAFAWCACQRRLVRKLVIFTTFIGILCYAPGNSASASAYARVVENPTSTPRPAATFAPFLDVVPAPDGTELYISASSPFSGNALVSIDEGPTGHKGGWTMTYSETIQTYVAQATGFTPGLGSAGSLNITTTAGLESGSVSYARAYVPAGTTDTLSSVDGRLQLSIVNADTFPAATYTAIVPSFAPPDAPPTGYSIVGSVYSARESGAKPETNRPMSLRLYYDPASLAGADPHMLAIMRWNADPIQKRWEQVGGRLFAAQGYLSAAVSRFGTYALMTTPAWRDDFDDIEGLELATLTNVAPGVQGMSRVLGLNATPGSGSAISHLIAPTIAISGWDTLIYTATVNSPVTSLAVDVLGSDGAVLLSDVHSRASLAGIDPVRYPALKLRARLMSSATGQTPALDCWLLTWRPALSPRWRVYLPAATRTIAGGSATAN